MKKIQFQEGYREKSVSKLNEGRKAAANKTI